MGFKVAMGLFLYQKRAHLIKRLADIDSIRVAFSGQREVFLICQQHFEGLIEAKFGGEERGVALHLFQLRGERKGKFGKWRTKYLLTLHKPINTRTSARAERVLNLLMAFHVLCWTRSSCGRSTFSK